MSASDTRYNVIPRAGCKRSLHNVIFRRVFLELACDCRGRSDLVVSLYVELKTLEQKFGILEHELEILQFGIDDSSIENEDSSIVYEDSSIESC